MAVSEILEFECDPSLEGMARLVRDVVYSTATGQELKLTLMLPWNQKNPRPLVVFVQGSGWTHPDVDFEIPQLSQLARMGYVVATIDHRSATEGHPFPAYLQDTKTAIRFLRAHAAEYGIDPARVCIYGTSSGGNTALLVGLTGDDSRFKTDEYSQQSDSVQLVVECFGPANLLHMLDSRACADPESIWQQVAQGLAGNNDPQTVIAAMSPVNYVLPNRAYPPFFLLHGDADTLVPYEQSLEMLQTLQAAGIDVRMARVHGAPHEGSFWSEGLVAEIFRYIRERL